MTLRDVHFFWVVCTVCALCLSCGSRPTTATETSNQNAVSTASAGQLGARPARVTAGAEHAAAGGVGGVRAAAGGVSAPVHVAGAEADAAGSAPEAAKSPGVPPEVTQAMHEWPLPGRDYNNSRYTQDSPIDSSNVSKLAEAWRVELPGLSAQFGKCSTAPLILGGVVYLEDTWSSVKAIELASGRVKWSVDASDPNIGPNGVAVGWGKVFAIGASDSVVAYDAETGKRLWTQRVVDTNTDGIDIQPIVFDDMVLVSTVPISLAGQYTGGDRGILKALDQKTGEVRWRFDTIKSDDIWGNPQVNSGGGSWYPPSIDIEHGRVFWGIGNPAPFPGTASFPNGSSRLGDNLYTNSTLVLDVHTGSYVWHYQTVQHDLLDRDVLHSMLTEVLGIQVVVSTGKEGRVWAHRRDTGALLWGPLAVGAHMNDELLQLEPQTRVLPGTFGGVLTPPALADGVVYVATLNVPTTYSGEQSDFFGSQLGTMPGNLVAIDVASGMILWDAPVDGDPTGGVTVVNDLVITATFQGKVFAYQRQTGEEVWHWTAPGGINAWLSVAGDTLVIPVGSSVPAVVVALRLGATEKAESSGAAGGAAAGSGAAGQAAAMPGTSTFSSLYAQILAPRCASPLCHGSTSSTRGALSIPAGASASTVWSSLLNQPASGSQCTSAGLALVVPGNPDVSLLYRKLSDMPPCGSRMPPTAALSTDEIDRVRTWIANGAEDD